MAHRKLWLLMLITAVPACLASTNRPGVASGRHAVLPHPQFTSALRRSETPAQLSAEARPSCEASRPPQALATPDPLLPDSDAGAKVAISFIIGTDGRVHAPVILESSGSAEAQGVLEAVLGWRYRPATCNASPTETEGRVEFSIH
jgi:TonB family protein